jgi:hypothetical protein
MSANKKSNVDGANGSVGSGGGGGDGKAKPFQSLLVLPGSCSNWMDAVLNPATMVRSTMPAESLQALHVWWRESKGGASAEECAAHARKFNVHADSVRKIFQALNALARGGQKFAWLRCGAHPPGTIHPPPILAEFLCALPKFLCALPKFLCALPKFLCALAKFLCALAKFLCALAKFLCAYA